MNNQSITIILFGATGDLARKKLLPSLFDLYKKDCLPKDFSIVGFSRKSLSDDEYRDFSKEAIKNSGHDVDEEKLKNFLSKIKYTSGDITLIETYSGLAEFLEENDKSFGHCSNKLFYLAVSPNLYEPVFTNIAKSGLSIPCSGGSNEDKNWTRILVEKPFGEDLEKAQSLDMFLGSLYDESQIFRIDHYLAKETAQNILTFRFANTLFDPVWNSEHVESISVRFYEKDGIRDRGAFYDGIGALRDVGQNHMLQILALITMNDPKEMDVQKIRTERAKILQKLRLWKGEEDSLIRGQYFGYKDVEGVAENSDTETYFKIALEIDSDEWRGIPMYLESGKSLHEGKVEIEILFKERQTCVCPPEGHAHHKNKITISIQPKESIMVEFWAKRPGFEYMLDAKDLSFNYDSYDVRLPDAYERVLYDAIRGDQTLFTTTDEVIAQWKITEPILEAWKNLPLIVYEQNSDPRDII